MQPGGTYPLYDSWESLFPAEGSEWLDPGALEVAISKASAREMKHIEVPWQIEQFRQPGPAPNGEESRGKDTTYCRWRGWRMLRGVEGSVALGDASDC